VNVQIPPLVNVFVFSYATPVEREKILVRHAWSADGGRGLTRPVKLLAAWVAGQASMRQAFQDRSIWNHKIHRVRPMLAQGDRMIGSFRKWARQFYSESNGEPSDLQL
jgi:hypothetical protein